MIDNGFAQLTAKIARLSAHVIKGSIQSLAPVFFAHVRHVLAQQILQGLTHGIALCHDAFAAIVSGARRVSLNIDRVALIIQM